MAETFTLTKKEEEAKTLVLDRKRTYLDWVKPNYFDKWDHYYNQYRSVIENEAEYPYMARLFIPYSFVSVETTIPRMVESIFASDPIVALKPEEEQDVEPARLNEQLLNYQYRRMDYLDTYMLSVKDACICGNTFNKVDWREEYAWKKRIATEEVYEGYDEMGSPAGEPKNMPIYDDNGKPVKEKFKHKIYDDPYIYPISPYKLLIDPGADPKDPIQSAEAVIFITDTTIPKIKEKEELGIYKKGSAAKVKQVKGSTDYTEGDQRLRDTDVTPYDRKDDKHSERVLIYEYWENDRLIVLAEEKVVLRDEESPYFHCRKPFTMARICPVSNEIYGIGMMEMVESLQHELNDTRNQRIDNIKLALNKMYIIARDADIDINNLINQPGGVILSNYIEGVKEITTSPVTQDSFRNAQDIAEDIQRAHGIHDPALGKPTSRETATGVLSLQEAANMRFQIMVRIFGKLLSLNTALMDELNQQFITGEKVFRLTNRDYVKIDNIEDIVGRYDYEPAGASLEGLSKYARLEQLLRFRGVFADNEYFDKTKFDKKIMELLNFKDANQYFKDPQQLQQEMMQQQMPQLAMQQMQQGMEGGGMPQMPQVEGGEMPMIPGSPMGGMEELAESLGSGAPPFNQMEQ